MLGLADATQRARLRFRGVARTRPRRQDRNAPREGLRADLAPPEGCQSWRRARRVTFAHAAGNRSCAVHADRGMRDSRAYARSPTQEAAILSAQPQFKKGAPWVA